MKQTTIKNEDRIKLDISGFDYKVIIDSLEAVYQEGIEHLSSIKLKRISHTMKYLKKMVGDNHNHISFHRFLDERFNR